MGKGLLVAVIVVLFVYALFDLIATPSARARYLPKPLWFLVLLLVPIGPLLWIVIGRSRSLPTLPQVKPGRPRPPQGPRGPDDDPEYLRKL